MAKKDVKTTLKAEEITAASIPENELPLEAGEEAFEDSTAVDAAGIMPQVKKGKKQLIHDLVGMGRA